MQIFKVGDIVICKNIAPFPNTKIAPPLKDGQSYRVEKIIKDSKGNQHLHVGLDSEYEYVTSQETGEQLLDGDKTHWCHPSRFDLL